MKTFDTLPLRLTPLTPIHVGCGMDFEPTNYVIDDGVLFHFDPAQVALSPEDQRVLTRALEGKATDVILNVQRYFYERRDKFAATAREAIPVAKGVDEWYSARVGKIVQREAGNEKVTNQLEIERTAHHPHTGEPYLPGSSIKGAIRTGWLNNIDDLATGVRRREERAHEKSADLEAQLLGGKFATDPFRLVKLADASGAGIWQQIVLAVDRDKEVRIDRSTGRPREKNLFVRREVVLGGQYRAFSSEIRIDSLGGLERSGLTPAPNKRIGSFEVLACACNDFYLARMLDELSVLDERRFAEGWLAAFRELIDSLEPDLRAGRLMLLRVGRHSGAECVTLARHRWVMIKGGKKRPTYYAKSPTTLWLAGKQINDRVDLLPFGWLLIEPADRPDVPELKRWCEVQPKPDLTAVRARLSEARAKAAAEAAANERQARERAAREAEEQRMANEREARKASLSEQGRLVEALREKLDKHTGRKQPVGGSLYGEIQKLLKPALQEGWTEMDKRALADLIASPGFEKIDFGGKAREIKRAINQLRGEA